MNQRLVPLLCAAGAVLGAAAVAAALLGGGAGTVAVVLAALAAGALLGALLVLGRRHSRMLERIVRDAEETRAVVDRLDRRLTRGKFGLEEVTRRLVTRDVSALLALHDLAPARGELPSASAYVATPEALLSVVGVVSTLPAGSTVVEAGSGLSTTWIATAAKAYGRDITIVSLDHEREYAASTVSALERLGLGSLVDLRYAPLEEVDVEGASGTWYASSGWADLTSIDLLVVDGPPKATGIRARYPALPLLEHALADGALVLLDDTDRVDEQEIVELWLSRSGVGTYRVERTVDRATLLRFTRNASHSAAGAPTA